MSVQPEAPDRLASAVVVGALVHGLVSVGCAAAGAPYEEPAVYIDGTPVPADEGGALNTLHGWLDKLHWTAGWEEGDTSQMAFMQLQELVAMVPQAPWLALGLGQAFLLYFWWRGTTLEVDIDAGRIATQLHWYSIRAAGCDDVALPREVFDSMQCAWRWRHVLMIPAEMGIHLARRRSDPRLAAAFLREASDAFVLMRKLPHFQRSEWVAAYDINTNADFFPGPVNRPVWPSSSVPFAGFLESHVGVFRNELDTMLRDGSFDHLYWSSEVSLTQFAPKHEGWAMVSLFKNRARREKVCAHAPASCALLERRPELSSCEAGDAGAAFARLLPGHG